MSPQDPNDPERNASPQNSDYNKPIVLTGHSIIEKIDQRKLSKKPARKFPYPGKTADQLSEEVISINVNGDPAHVKLKFLNSRILTEVWVKLLKMKFEKKRRKGKGRNE